MTKSKKVEKSRSLEKAPTGIRGFDEITGGGLPKGRPTLLCGSAGAGKTIFAMEFLVRGAVQFNEPGVYMPFEENAEELIENFSSLGYNLDRLCSQKKLTIDHVFIERSQIIETGEYDLEGLFVRLGHAIDSIGAKRVVLDTLEALFSGFPDAFTLRAELRRLFRWLKEKGVTAIVTGERGDTTLTRHGLEEYVADCVIVLDHRVTEQISTRRVRILKYRGSSHGTNEYPFLIGNDGLSVFPITSLDLDHKAGLERVSSGIPQLDDMLEGKGYYRGSTVLVSGGAGTGKTSIAASLACRVCQGEDRCLYFAFEESESEITRNMRSIGMDLRPWIRKGLLHFEASRPTSFGLEQHLSIVHKRIEEVNPSVVIIDPITNFISIGVPLDIKSMVTRLIDFLKSRQITALFTSLSHPVASIEHTDATVSSLMDTWIALQQFENSGERIRSLYILKSRGMAHSARVRGFGITRHGIVLGDEKTSDQ
jgi:circadian clock protein KaiC